LNIPRALQRSLPFKSKPKLEKAKSNGKMEKLMKIAVIREEKDKNIADLMHALHTMKKDKKQKKREKNKKSYAEHQKKLAKAQLEEKFRHKESKKRLYKELNEGTKKKKS
jgi:ribosome biogenesis protein BMS1